MDDIVGVSDWTQTVRRVIARVACFRCNVLVTGPSGTGKELIARAIHQQSPRAAGPLVPVNCTAIPAALFASQLFGHVRGAFTGAGCETLGCFRAAEGGTIFLDEIGELSLELQTQLLRVIQQRAVVPVGSHRELPVDVRLIAATNRRIEDDVRAGRFRTDLYYRLNVVRIRTLPLAERPEDIEPLTQRLLARLAVESGLPSKRLSAGAISMLTSFPWQGNVRELQNILERAVVFAPGPVITERELLDQLEPAGPRGDGYDEPPRRVDEPGADWDLAAAGRFPMPTTHAATALPSLAEWESRLIRAALDETFHNQSAAARLLQIDRRLLARKIRKFGLMVEPSWHKAPAPKRS